jgi:AGCS family alanine or glycine:cation symporter
MQELNHITSVLVDYFWGLPLLLFLLISNLIFLFYSRFKPLIGFAHAFKILRMKKSENVSGQISHFKALSNALAATIGLGNISGVTIAIIQGGPGAIFWMWVAALLGMNTKFFECSLAVMHRGKDYLGEVQGGPMYVIEKIWNNKTGKLLAYFFAICGLFGTLSLFQISQLTDFVNYKYGVDRYIVGLVCSLIVFGILYGGIERISNVTSKLVPLMSLFYFGTCLTIILLNIEKLPELISDIISQALNIKSVAGGVSGYAIKEIISSGVKRATFSNEAGIGTAPMAHANVNTNEPIREGYVAMLGPFFDTIVICTMTALTVLIVQDDTFQLSKGGIIGTTMAFEHGLGQFGGHLLGIGVLLFSFSTMIGMANYNEKCWNFVFRGKKFFKRETFLYFYMLTIILGSLFKLDIIVNLMDICYASMSIPNILITIYLAREISERMKDYNRRHGL